jgi:hypothetical protein
VLNATGAYRAGDRWEPALDVAGTWLLVLALAVLLGWAERPLPIRRRGRTAPSRDYAFEGNVVADLPAVDDRA